MHFSSSSRLNDAQRAARLGWWEHDLSSGRLTWSDELCRLWGIEPGRQPSFEEVLARVHPDDRQLLGQAIGRLGQVEGPVWLDFRATVADGRQCRFRGGAHAVRDEKGIPVQTFGTAQDVTELKQAEHDLETTKALYRASYQSSLPHLTATPPPEHPPVNRTPALRWHHLG